MQEDAESPLRSQPPRTFGTHNTYQRNSTAQHEASTFHVEVPHFYKSSRTVRSSDQKIAAVEDGGRLPIGSSRNVNADGSEFLERNEVEQQHARMSEQTRVRAPAKAEDEDDIRLEKKARSDHDDFISALEKHGSSAGAWRAIASELESTVDSVKVRAYSYFKTLVQDRTVNNGDDHVGKCSPTDDGSHPSTTPDAAWSFNELVLLDSLMLKHCKDLNLNCFDKKQESEGESPRFIHKSCMWDRVASQFPGKTAAQCKEYGMANLRRLKNEGE